MKKIKTRPCAIIDPYRPGRPFATVQMNNEQIPTIIDGVKAPLNIAVLDF